MKATGIVRRIDDLGRVVIPKEIRRTMRIREGDPLEIFTNREGEVIFKKYSPIGEINSFASQYAETLHKTCNLSVVICDRDAVIASSGVPRKEYAEKRLSRELEEIIEKRSLYVRRDDDAFTVTADGLGQAISVAMPILAEGDLVGCVISLLPKENEKAPTAHDVEVKLVQTAAGFLGKQLEG